MTLTYTAINNTLETATPSKQAQKNLLSAMKQWLACHGIDEAHHPERHLGADGFKTALEKFKTHLKKQGVAQSTVKDRCTLIRKLQRLYFNLKADVVELTEFASALRSALNNQSITQKSISQSIGVTEKTLSTWASGLQTPSRRHQPKIERIEQIIGLANGALVNRLEHCYGDSPEGACYSLTPHRKNLINGKKNPYQLRHDDVPPLLKQEWLDLLSFKTQILPMGVRRSTSWRTKDAATMPGTYVWGATLGTKVCPSASLNFYRMLNFMGFAIFPSAKGGRGLDRQAALTLASFADPALVQQFVEFIKARSGAHNGNTKSTLGLIRNLLRPKVGFLWQNTEYGQRYLHGPLGPTAWQQHCEDVYYYLGEMVKDLEGQVQKTRNPQEPIQWILDLPQPIGALIDFVEVMERKGPPKSWKKRYAVHNRDLLLAKMLTANPLRAHHFAIMTYRKDNTGNLFKKVDGSWWLRYKASDFKNQRGAANKDYEMRLSPWLWQSIEEYLTKYRPMLAGANTDFVFRPRVNDLKEGESQSMMDSKVLGGLMSKATHKYMKNCVGFGCHAFRHIIATDFIRNHPKSYIIAATILHDKIETVMEEYAHLRKADEFEAYNNYLDELINKGE